MTRLDVNPVTCFLRALGRLETYRPDRNLYALFGFLWGLPVPVATMGVHLAVADLPVTPEGIRVCLGQAPWHLFFLAHPFLFLAVFGALGTLARDQEERIQDLIARLQTLAETDGLTGLLNQKTFFQRLETEIARAGRTGTPLSVLMMDLDNFKAFNDTYGHLGGDTVLTAVARELRRHVRSYDFVCRYGGEEFAAALPGLDARMAWEVADRFRRAVERMDLPLPVRPAPRITVSVGVARWNGTESLGALLTRADANLYAAKRAGRNVVCGGETAG